MAAMEVGTPNPQGRPRGAGSQGSQGYANGRGPPTDDYGRSSLESQRRPPPNEYGRTSAASQRSAGSRDYPPQGPPQQGYPDSRRGPPGPPNPGYGPPPPRQNGYGEPQHDQGGYAPGPASPIRENNFAAPGRSMTMPNEAPMQMGRQPGPPLPMDGPGASAPYNGPAGRMPPRPSTSNNNRPPPQRIYPTQAPPIDPYANAGGTGAVQGSQRRESVSDFYDSYYEDPQGRPESTASEMPNFNALPNNPGSHRRGTSIDGHIQAPIPQQNYQPLANQLDSRGRAQPQAAVFEMAGDAAPMPNGYQDDGYGNRNQGSAQRGPPQQSYGGFEQPFPPNGFQPPPRSQSAAPGAGRPMGLPNGPKPGFNGLPPGPSPMGGMPRTNTMPTQPPPEGFPSHPVPVRAGLIPNSVANQANNKPPPVRNYNNVSPGQGPPPAPSPVGAPLAVATATVTSAELEQLRLALKNNPTDQTTQMILARKLVEASDVLVPLLPDQRTRTKARERYIMDAHKLLKKLVASQSPEAMFYLADCYGRGALGLETDNKEAFTLYQSAAKAGHAAAAYRTAVCCELGNEEGGGTRKDPLKAIQWYKRAATLGDTPAMYKMGMIQLKGLLGQPRNPREAVGWLKRAAERADAENPHALHELGLLYEAPQAADGSVVRDEGYSFSLFQQSADLGYKFSQFRLGAAFEYGLFNCPIDPRQSIMWYSKAAAQEEHQSELALSGWYLTGSEGVLQQSDTEAYLWARKAAMAGLAKAEYAMGYFTEVGIGSPANLEDAKRWYWRAAGEFAFFHTFNLRIAGIVLTFDSSKLP